MTRILRIALLSLAAASLAGCDTVTGIFTSDDRTVLPGERLSVMELGAQLEVDAGIAGDLVLLPDARVNESWPQPGGNPTNANGHLSAPGPLRQIWSVSAGSGSDRVAQLLAAPIVADGRIYVLDARTRLGAFEQSSGRKLWDVNLVPKGENASSGRGGGVAYENGRLFVATGYGEVHGVEAASGNIAWTQAIGDPFRSAPTASGGRVFAITSDNQTIALSQETGDVVWRHRGIVESAGILATSSPAVAGSTVIVPYSSGELVALRVENGTPVWTDSLTRTGSITSLSALNDIAGRPVVDRDRVFAISHSGRMVSIDLRTGERVWTREIGGVQTPWVAGDFIYLVTSTQEVIAVSRRDGRIRWITPLQRWRNPDKRTDPVEWSGPVLVSERLVLVSSRGDSVMISAPTGEVLGNLAIPSGALVAPVVANETVYVLTDNARLTALK
ncbi:PQQ-binding-like beta-propeller repeat protein [Parvibaculum sp.]|uniref:PQQ-like beta-propeller repeat protein n=1 Tax=Parvibaculum sp. TaxID=2024848 RepID=UPI003919A97C